MITVIGWIMAPKDVHVLMVWVSLMAQIITNLPAVQAVLNPETQVRSLGWEDPMEKGMATHTSVPAWGIPWTEEPGRLQSH